MLASFTSQVNPEPLSTDVLLIQELFLNYQEQLGALVKNLILDPTQPCHTILTLNIVRHFLSLGKQGCDFLSLLTKRKSNFLSKKN